MLRPVASDATSFFETPNAAPRDDWPPGMARGSIPRPEHQVCAVPNQRPPSREGHRFAAEEVLEAAIGQAEQVNPAINAIVHKQYEQARKAVAAGLPEGFIPVATRV